MAKSAKKNQVMKQPDNVKVVKKEKGKINKAPNIPTPKNKPTPKSKANKKVKKTKPQTGDYVLSSAYRKLAYQLNKAYDEVRDAMNYSNNIKLFEQTLEAFYEKHNLKVRNPHHISMQKQMPAEAVEELAKITLRFADIAVEDRSFILEDLTKGLSKEDIAIIQQKQQEAIIEEKEEMEIGDVKFPWDKFDVDKYNQIQDMYGVKSVQDFINWTDEMERFRQEKFLLSVLSSDQIADIFVYAMDQQKNLSKDGSKADLDFKAISKMAYRVHMQNGGIKGDKLRNAIYDRISRVK